MVAVSADGTVEDVAWFTVDHVSATGTARRAAASLARRVGMSEARAGEVALVVAELTANQINHAGSGSLLLRVRHATSGPVVEAVAVDSGPGMVNVAASLTDGVSSAGTLGIGLGTLSRLATSFDIWSRPTSGTVVTAAFAADDAPRPGVPTAVGVTRPMTGQDVCGDAYAIRHDDGVLSVMLADGLGHGPLAAAASTEAVRAFRGAAPGGPLALLTAVHRALSGTRGAAVAVARLDAGEVRYAGVGNIAGTVLDGVSRRGMISHPGIAGAQARTLREAVYPLPPGGVVVLHSDGVTDRHDLAAYPGLLSRTALVVAAVLLRDFGVRRDDASVVVARTSPAVPA